MADIKPNGAPSSDHKPTDLPRIPPALVAWRREQRASLIARRETLSSAQREAATATVARALETLLRGLGTRRIGLYWPIRHEFNLVPWARQLARDSSLTLCLPVVVTPKAPLEYWRWTPGEPMAKGLWNIPIPTRRDPVDPDLVLAPMVGFDRAMYRLGYGGGYFDRTLACRHPRPFAVGIGFDFSALESITPQPHDIPMDAIVTEQRRIP